MPLGKVLSCGGQRSPPACRGPEVSRAPEAAGSPICICRRRPVRLLVTLQSTEDPGGEGTLALGNLSGLVQARRKLKNFPTKTFTSRRDKKQLRVINPCQHPGPRGQARGPKGDQRALRMRKARGEIPGHQGTQLVHKRSGHRSPRCSSRLLVGSRGSGLLAVLTQ